jgi:hypothetical protein
MAQTATKSAKATGGRTHTTARKRAPAQKVAAAGKTTTAELKDTVVRTAELSEDVLKSVEAGQRAALEAVRKFVDTVDEALPALGDRPSRRERVIDAAMEMADRLITTQYDFLRNAVRSAERSLSKPGDATKT